MKHVYLALALVGWCGCNNDTATTPTVDPVAASTLGAIPDPGETVLTVNGTPVGTRELDLVFRRMRVPDEQREKFAWSRGGKHVTEEYALATVLYQRALAEGVAQDPEVALQIAFATRQILGSAMREKLAHAAITDEGVKAYYDANIDRFNKPEVHLKQIAVTSASMAQSMIDRLKQGEDFAILAKAHSADQATAARGGDRGWVHESDLPEFGKEVFAAPEGAVLGPIEGREGFFVFQVVGKRDSTPLEDVRPAAEAQLSNTEMTKVIEEMRKSMKIEWVVQPEGGGPLDPNEAGNAAPPGGAPPAGAPPADGAQAPTPPQHPSAGG